jgi:hypothetical protein
LYFVMGTLLLMLVLYLSCHCAVQYYKLGGIPDRSHSSVIG